MLNVTHKNLNISSMEVVLFSIFAMQGPPLSIMVSAFVLHFSTTTPTTNEVGMKGVWAGLVEVFNNKTNQSPQRAYDL